ncbi:MAG: hypothetical protein CK426_08070 [Legionella sp.]|nr:MAG: hypothetical protein CK423_00975 [Legionella sp.]PJD97387.1 MAG: hypothetical protein CK426_08070 [Legionella sp.]
MNILVAISGTTIAQLLPILITPLLTRLYSPTDFGIFSLYLGIVSICSVIVSARYELAIMQSKSDKEAINVTSIAVFFTFLNSLLLLFLIYLLKGHILQWLGNHVAKHDWLYLIPICVGLTGLSQIFSYWYYRKKLFTKVAIAKTAQGIGLSLTQTGLNSHIFSFGLIWGHIIGALTSVMYLLYSLWGNHKSLLGSVSKNRLLKFLYKYKNYPMYSLWGALLDAVAIQVPIFMLNKYYDSNTTGIFSLTFRTLNLPMTLISTSISQVLFQKISELNQTEQDSASKLIIKLFSILVGISIPLIFILFFWGENLFSMVFGSEWEVAGKYASILIFAVAIRFSVSPLSTVLALNHNLKIGFLWQATYFCTIICTLYSARGYNIEIFITIFVIHELILYLLYLFLIIKGTKRC